MIWRLAEHPGGESLHACFFLLLLPLYHLILAGDRMLCQIIWAQITWSNTCRLSHTWWSQLCNEIMSLAHSEQPKVRIISLCILSRAGVVLTSVIAQLTPLELDKPHKIFPCFLPQQWQAAGPKHSKDLKNILYKTALADAILGEDNTNRLRIFNGYVWGGKNRIHILVKDFASSSYTSLFELICCHISIFCEFGWSQQNSQVKIYNNLM